MEDLFDVRVLAFLHNTSLCCKIGFGWNLRWIFWFGWQAFIENPYGRRNIRIHCVLKQSIVTYQTPPGTEDLSKTVMSRPSALQCTAAETPLTPAPMIPTDVLGLMAAACQARFIYCVLLFFSKTPRAIVLHRGVELSMEDYDISSPGLSNVSFSCSHVSPFMYHDI